MSLMRYHNVCSTRVHQILRSISFTSVILAMHPPHFGSRSGAARPGATNTALGQLASPRLGCWPRAVRPRAACVAPTRVLAGAACSVTKAGCCRCVVRCGCRGIPCRHSGGAFAVGVCGRGAGGAWSDRGGWFSWKSLCSKWEGDLYELYSRNFDHPAFNG